MFERPPTSLPGSSIPAAVTAALVAVGASLLWLWSDAAIQRLLPTLRREPAANLAGYRKACEATAANPRPALFIGCGVFD